MEQHDPEYVDIDEYLASEGVNATLIKAGATSMMAMRHRALNPAPDTPAMRWGRLVHLAVLEPGKLAGLPVWTGGDRRTREWREFAAEHEGETIVTPDQQAALTIIAQRCRENAVVAEALAGCRCEVSLAWEAPEYGKARGRLDGWKRGLVVDVKSAERIDQRSIEGAVMRYGYHLQVGWYCEGLQRCGLDSTHDTAIVAIQSGEPYDVALYRVGYDLLEYGQREAIRIAAEYRRCCELAEWPGVQAAARAIGLPTYLMPDMEDGDDE